MSEEDPQARASRLEREAEEIRRHLDGLLGELDRRRHAAADFTRHLGRLAVPIAVSLVAAAATVWGVVALVQRKQARRRSLAYRSSVLGRRVTKRAGLLAGQAGVLAGRAGERTGELAGLASGRARELAGRVDLKRARKLLASADPRQLW